VCNSACRADFFKRINIEQLSQNTSKLLAFVVATYSAIHFPLSPFPRKAIHPVISLRLLREGAVARQFQH
jgi:hypothetical protein